RAIHHPLTNTSLSVARSADLSVCSVAPSPLSRLTLFFIACYDSALGRRNIFCVLCNDFRLAIFRGLPGITDQEKVSIEGFGADGRTQASLPNCCRWRFEPVAAGI